MFQVPIVHPNVPSSRCMCLCSSPPSLWARSNPNKWPAPPLDSDFTDEKQISILIWLNWQMRRMQISISYRFGWIAGECASPCVPAQLALNSSVLLSAETHSRSIETAVKGLPASPSPHSTFPWRRKSELFTTWEVGLRLFPAADYVLPQMAHIFNVTCTQCKYSAENNWDFCFSILPSIHSMSSSIWNIPSGDVYHS